MPAKNLVTGNEALKLDSRHTFPRFCNDGCSQDHHLAELLSSPGMGND